MHGPQRENEELLFRLPRIRRPFHALAAAALLLTSVAAACDLYGLSALVGAPFTWDYTIGPVIGFVLLSTIWLGLVAVTVRLFVPLLRSRR